MCTYVNTYMSTYVNTYMHTCVSTCMCVLRHMYVCMSMWVYNTKA